MGMQHVLIVYPCRVWYCCLRRFKRMKNRIRRNACNFTRESHETQTIQRMEQSQVDQRTRRVGTCVAPAADAVAIPQLLHLLFACRARMSFCVPFATPGGKVKLVDLQIPSSSVACVDQVLWSPVRTSTYAELQHRKVHRKKFRR